MSFLAGLLASVVEWILSKLFTASKDAILAEEAKKQTEKERADRQKAAQANLMLALKQMADAKTPGEIEAAKTALRRAHEEADNS